ncbi:3-keto-5-aminohexanoate cleavage protein [Candidatus Micrarchaeota archaeon]|nr:3-keto-5-aminohexanoate cleavage protein [Candidatus Micrarchaeota archaeon]
MGDEGNEVYGLSGTSSIPLQKKLIINVALTGNFSSKSANPNVPTTPEEIASDARKCYEAGAVFFHIHARESDGTPSCSKGLFEEILAKVRKKCPDAILCATTSGRVFKTFEQRAAVLDLEGESKPDFASLSMGSMNFPTEPSVNSPDMIERLARHMAARGIRPELEVFETGMINYAAYLERKKFLSHPLYINLFFGLLGTMPGRFVDIVHQVGSLPAGSVWGAAGGGKFQLPVNTCAIVMGGHVRVGLEDNLYYDYGKTVLATNEMLIKRIARIADELGRPIATPAQAREILGLKAAP